MLLHRCQAMQNLYLNKLLPELKDPRSFTILCTIGSCNFGNVLCDLGSSINLIFFSVLQRLGWNEPTPTNVTLQLADKLITYPKGILEDVLVKVDKFIFLSFLLF